MRRFGRSTSLLVAALFSGVISLGSHAQSRSVTRGAVQICSIDFDKDEKLPARVEDGALPCLEQAVKRIKETPDIKLVLVGLSHPEYDHAEAERGMERDVEDATGADIRFSDVAAYRAIDTKAYLTQWLGADATRIIPTTDYLTPGRRVIIYSVPGDADYWHNYTNTTPVNESKCTIKPCPDSREEVLSPIVRPRIVVARTSSAQ